MGGVCRNHLIFRPCAGRARCRKVRSARRALAQCCAHPASSRRRARKLGHQGTGCAPSSAARLTCSGNASSPELRQFFNSVRTGGPDWRGVTNIDLPGIPIFASADLSEPLYRILTGATKLEKLNLSRK